MSELSEKRLAICKECPLYKESILGPVCDPNKYINKDGKVSYLPKPGYKKGCNCLLLRKTINPNNHCIALKW